MPIYVYECNDCGSDHELLQKLSDPPATTCPQCGHESLRKQLTAAGFQLKGSGWYATDFKSSGTKPSAPSKESGAGAKSGEGASPTAESATPTESASSGGCGNACACHP